MRAQRAPPNHQSRRRTGVSPSPRVIAQVFRPQNAPPAIFSHPPRPFGRFRRQKDASGLAEPALGYVDTLALGIPRPAHADPRAGPTRNLLSSAPRIEH